MTALRPLMGEEEGAAKAAQARDLFARAHALFPVQTTILRNWAQIEFDGGNVPAAYRLLDQMETLQPASEEPYVERLLMARQAGDAALYAATVARAERRLEAPALGAAAPGLVGVSLKAASVSPGVGAGFAAARAVSGWAVVIPPSCGLYSNVVKLQRKACRNRCI